MKERSAQHATFVIERSYPASPARLFRAFTDPAAKARWFSGPAGQWRELERRHDLRVGGRELVRGAFADGPVSTYDAIIHDLVEGERLVYSYTMKLDEVPISVSLSTVQIAAAGDGVRLHYTEQVVFLDGYDDAGKRKMGSEGLFDQLGASLTGEPDAGPDGGLDGGGPAGANEILSSRRFDASPEELFAAFADPARLTRWWGPDGFTSTFRRFELRPGGAWDLTLHGPDGKHYPNRIVFLEVEPGRLVVYEHHPTHFRMRMTFAEQGGGARLTWRMSFESAEQCEKMKPVVVPSNEQNFDRLAAELARGRAG